MYLDPIRNLEDRSIFAERISNAWAPVPGLSRRFTSSARRDDMIERKNKERNLEARLAEFERSLRNAESQTEIVYASV